MHYYFCSFTEIHGELEFPEKFILRCPANVNAEHRFDDILLNYRTGGEKDTDGVINFVSGSSIKKTDLKTLTPDEYRVLKQFLTVI